MACRGDVPLKNRDDGSAALAFTLECALDHAWGSAHKLCFVDTQRAPFQAFLAFPDLRS
jgi:hypothetical protein